MPSSVTSTLIYLNLTKKYRATLIPENPQSLGMLRKVKDVVAWSSANQSIVKELLEKKGRIAGFKPVSSSDLPKEYDGVEALAAAISDDRLPLSQIGKIKPWFALSPPRGGFKRKTKNQYNEGGVLGEDKELVDIVRRML